MQRESKQEGTVIAGTLRTNDLIVAFYRELVRVAPVTAKIRKKGTWGDEIVDALNGREVGEDGMEAAQVLQNDLDANAPLGYYFGTLEGDASDFGWWPHSWSGETGDHE